MRFLLLLGLITFMGNVAFGQTDANASVGGQVVEQSTKEPMEFANVMLFETSNESPVQVQATTTGKEGDFLFAGIPAGDYFVEVSFIGFETKRTKIFSLTGQGQEMDLEEIPIRISENLLEEVEIIGEKSTYNFSLDRMIYNVEKDLLSQTGSVFEILENIPSITVDIDGQVSLRGTSNITFFINGRPSPLLRASGPVALQQFPAGTVERIEVITNPSAKYRPDGVGGIINIVLKEKRGEGLNGTVIGNVGNLNRQNASVTLNYGLGKVNVFGSYGIRHANNPETRLDTRIDKTSNGEILSLSETSSTSDEDKFSQIVNAGLEFSVGEGTQVEISGIYDFGKDDEKTLSNWQVEDEFSSAFSVGQHTIDREKEYEISAAMEHEFDEDQTLALEFNYAGYDESDDSFFDEQYTAPFVSNAMTRNLIEGSGPLAELAIDYARPVGEESELEVGYAGEFLKDDIRFLGEDYYALNDTWLTDFDKTNHFIFTQNIHALYATFGHSMGAFSILAGLRAEQTMINSNLVTTQTEIPNNYFQLFPTLHLSFELSDDQEMQLSYSRRIDRADSDEHNPFPEYDDPRSREVGNPLLRPEQVHSIELGYRIQKESFSVMPTLYYRSTYDGFEEIREVVDDTVLQSRHINLSREQSAGLEFILTGNMNDILDITLSANGFYNEIDASDLGLSDRRSTFSWNSKLAVNLDIAKSTLAQLNAYYRSARLSPQGHSRSRFLLNFGMRQNILKNRASLVLTVSDVLASLVSESIIDTPELFRKRNTRRNRQIVHLGFVYRFGKAYNKKRDQLEFEDEI